MRCRDDADKDVVKQCLEHSLKGTVEVRAEDADILIMLTHRYHPDKYHLITVTTSNGNYCVKEVSLSLTNEQRQYLLLSFFYWMRYSVLSIWIQQGGTF